MHSWLNTMRNAPSPQRARASSSRKQPPSAIKPKGMWMCLASGHRRRSRHGSPSRPPFMHKAEKLSCSFGMWAASLIIAFSQAVKHRWRLLRSLQKRKQFSWSMACPVSWPPLNRGLFLSMKFQVLWTITKRQHAMPWRRASMVLKFMRPMAISLTNFCARAAT